MTGVQTCALPIYLKPNPRNPRRHSRQQVRALERSISEFGFIGAVIINRGCMILAGHALWLAAMRAGLKEVPTIEVSHLDEAHELLLMISFNRLGELSSFEDEALAGLFVELDGLKLDLDVEVTGFSVAEIDLMIQGGAPPPENGDVDPAPSPMGPPVSKLGDLWLLGEHRVLCGDATDPLTVARLMDGRLAAVAITDMPYNIPISGFVSGNGRTQHREFVQGVGEFSTDQFRAFIKSAATQLAFHTVDGGINYLFIDWRHLLDLQLACADVYDSLQNICTWVKNGAGLGSFYRSRSEFIVVYKKGKAPHRNNIQLGKFGRSRDNVWEYPNANTFSKTSEEGDILALHPTPKPVALVADAILDTTKRGDIVIDSFLGSGTAVIAAERTGRKTYGLELDPLYVDGIVRRWQKYTGHQAIQAISGKTFDELSAQQIGRAHV